VAGLETGEDSVERACDDARMGVDDGAVRWVPGDDPVAIDLLLTIRAGDVDTLRQLLHDDPELVSARFIGRLGKEGGWRTALHMVTDWPGYFPKGPEIVRLLVGMGADPNIDTGGGAPETPLHWAASSDDADVAAALIAGGADLEVPGGSIGTPLDNAVGYGCWHVARLLVANGARVTRAWHAAALGMLDELAALLGDDPAPDDVSQAFWHACSGGQRRAAEYLLSRGADLNWVPDYAAGTPLDAASGCGTQRDNVISWLRELGAQTAPPRTTDEPG
jgi:hypothetical protein